MMDGLITQLNTTGVTFVRDAWTNMPTGDYGVCTMVGEPSALWADDTMIAQRMTVTVHLYNKDGTDTNAKAVNEALKGADVMFVLNGREYLQDVNMIRWTWTVTMEQWYGTL